MWDNKYTRKRIFCQISMLVSAGTEGSLRPTLQSQMVLAFHRGRDFKVFFSLFLLLSVSNAEILMAPFPHIASNSTSF